MLSEMGYLAFVSLLSGSMLCHFSLANFLREEKKT